MSDSETLADRFKAIEKDIYYGYAITSHKSQASTYSYVIADEIDFMKIQDKFNFKYNHKKHTNHEQNNKNIYDYNLKVEKI